MCSQCSPLRPNDLGWPCAITPYLHFHKELNGLTYICTLASVLLLFFLLPASVLLLESYALQPFFLHPCTCLLPPDLHWLLPRLPPSHQCRPPPQHCCSNANADGALWPTWWLLCWMCTDTVKGAVECTLDVWHDNNAPTCMHEHTRTPKCSHSHTTLIPSHAQLRPVST